MLDCSHTTVDRLSLEKNNIKRKTSKTQIMYLLQRIFQKTKDEAFHELKLNILKKRKVFNIPLLLKKFDRDIQKAFFTLKLFTMRKYQQKMNQRLEARKNPQAIVTVISNLLKGSQAKGLLQLKNYTIKINILKKYSQIFCKLYKQLLKNRTKVGFHKIKTKVDNKKFAQILLKQIQRIEKKAIKRLKNDSMNMIIESNLKKRVAFKLEEKRQKNKQLSEQKVEKIKNLSSLREQVRNLQNNIGAESYQKNKSKVQMKKEAKIMKNKLQQEIKNMQKQMKTYSLEKVLLEKQLQNKQSYFKRRQSLKKKSQKGYDNLRQAFQIVFAHPQEQFRNLQKLKPLIKNYSIQQIDEFHIYENLKLKGLLRAYENNSFKVDTLQYNRSLCENQKLRSIIKTLVIKQFQPLSFYKSQQQV